MLFVGALLMAACSSDEDFVGGGDGVATGQPTEVTLRVMANDIAGLRAVGDEYAATAGEYINHVCVFVCTRSGDTYTIVQKIQPDLAASTDVTRYEETVTLKQGTYSLIAFANWHDESGKNCNATWAGIIARTSGGTITQAELDDVVISNLIWEMGFYDDNDGDPDSYIPMSGKVDGLVVDDNTTSLEVPMDRLFGKVVLNITNGNAEALTITKLEFKNCANDMTLFPRGDTSTTHEKGFIKNKAIEIAANATVQVTGYVNETKSGTNPPFDIEITTSDGVCYTAQTQYNDLARNNVYIIGLSLKRENVGVEAAMWAVPIDVAPTQYKVNTDLNDKTASIINVYDVTEKLQLSPYVPGGGIPVSWTWKVGNNDVTTFDKTDGDGNSYHQITGLDYAKDIWVYKNGTMVINNFRATAATDVQGLSLTGTWKNDHTASNNVYYPVSTYYNTFAGFEENFSRDHYTLEKGKSMQFKFYNYSNKEKNWENWILYGSNVPFESPDYKIPPYFAVRCDNWENVSGSNTGCISDFDFSNDGKKFRDDMNGSLVDMTVRYDADGTFTMTAEISGSSGATYNYTYTKTLAESPARLILFFVSEGSYISNIKADGTNVLQPLESSDHSSAVTSHSRTFPITLNVIDGVPEEWAAKGLRWRDK